MSDLWHYDEGAPSAPWFEAQAAQTFGDKLDAIVAATAEAFPDRPLERLGLRVELDIKPLERLGLRVELGLQPRHSGVITCRIGDKKDLRWILKVLGPPTAVIPGLVMSWTFGSGTLRIW